MINRNLILFAVYCLLIAVVISGCSDTQYLSEKLLWEAEKKTAEIYSKGRDKLKDSDYARIISLYRRVVDNCPLEAKAAKAQFVISSLYAAQGKYREGQKELTEIINNFSSRPDVAAQAQLAIGKLYEAQGKWEIALREYDKLMDLYPLTPLGLSMPRFIVNYFQNKNAPEKAQKAYERGVRHYQKILLDFKETDFVPTVQQYLASFHLEQAEFDKAIEVWNQIIDSSPGSKHAMHAFLLKGETYAQRIKDVDKAIRVYQDFIKFYSRYEGLANVQMRLASLYLKKGQVDKAKDTYLQVLKDDIGDDVAVKAQLGLSYCYRKENNTQKVIEVYENIKNIYPDHKASISIPYLIGKYYEESKFYSKADAAYQKAINGYKNLLESDDKKEGLKKEAANFLALCYIKVRQVSEAFRLLKMLAERYPQEPMYLLDIATLYIQLNSPEKAAQMYKKVIERFPSNKLVVRIAQGQLKALEHQASVEYTD